MSETQPTPQEDASQEPVERVEHAETLFDFSTVVRCEKPPREAPLVRFDRATTSMRESLERILGGLPEGTTLVISCVATAPAAPMTAEGPDASEEDAGNGDDGGTGDGNTPPDPGPSGEGGAPPPSSPSPSSGAPA